MKKVLVSYPYLSKPIEMYEIEYKKLRLRGHKVELYRGAIHVLDTIETKPETTSHGKDGKKEGEHSDNYRDAIDSGIIRFPSKPIKP